MQALLIAIITWLSANYGLPANYDLPAIQFATPLEIATLRYGAFNSQRQSMVFAAPQSQPRPSSRSIRTRTM